MSNSSPTWKYFQRILSSTAKCHECGKILNTAGGSTSGLLKHLRMKHNKNLTISNMTDNSHDSSSNKAARTDGLGPPAKIQKTLGFPQKNKRSLKEIVARLAAVDGISVNAITRSEFVSRALEKDGMRLPTSHSGVIQLIIDFANEKRQELSHELSKKKDQHERFSISADEWTSTANRRYLNVNIHRTVIDHASFLCALRIIGTFTAERVLECTSMTGILSDFDLNIEDIVCAITDGAVVMIKFGRLAPCEFQACLTHALHLAVCDVLYKKGASIDEAYDTVENDDIGEQANAITDETHDDDHNENFPCDVDSKSTILSNDFRVLISNVRKDVYCFRRSCKDNETLQKYVREKHGKELKLIADVRTRWNSLQAMLSRYVLLRLDIKRTFIDLNRCSSVTEEDFIVIQQLTEALDPMKVASDALCRSDATLLTAEAVIKFLMRKLESQDNYISKELLTRLQVRFHDRRNEMLFSLLKYLHNVDFSPKPSKSVIQKFAANLFIRLKNQAKKQNILTTNVRNQLT